MDVKKKTPPGYYRAAARKHAARFYADTYEEYCLSASHPVTKEAYENFQRLAASTKGRQKRLRASKEAEVRQHLSDIRAWLKMYPLVSYEVIKMKFPATFLTRESLENVRAAIKN
jgi:hypothetical protein